MARWGPPSDSSASEKKDWEEKPTWHAEYPSEIVDAEDKEIYFQNLRLAEAHVDWLLDPKNNQKNVQSQNSKNQDHWVVVAVMYDPVSNMHFASTVPRGKILGIMKNTGKRVAPRWEAAGGKAKLFHSEDAVYFNFESSDKFDSSGTSTGKYPRGTIISTFGKRDPKPGDKYPEGKVPLPPCKTSSSKSPTCQEVAKRLGVRFAEGFNGDDPKLSPDDQEDPDEYPADITEEDWADLQRQLCEQEAPKRLLIRGKEASWNKTEASSCRTDIYGSTPVSTFSYTKTFDVSLIGNNFTIVTPTESKQANQTSTDRATTTHSSTQIPTPSCYFQGEDPDRGINMQYCVCNGSRTLPLLTMSSRVALTSSCSYTTLPAQITTRVTNRGAAPITRSPKATITPGPSLDNRDISVHTGFDFTTTDSKYCKVCSQVDAYGEACQSLEGCFVKTGAVTIEAGTSSVHVGTLTGTQLYTSISSALDKICPTPSGKGDMRCSGDSVTIGGVPYVDFGALNKNGELVVSVESSKYNESSIRDALIKSAAAAAQQAATGKNCYQQTYTVEILKRSWLPSWVPRFLRRDHPFPQAEKATWCNTVGFAGPHYYNPWWRTAPNPGATDYIDAHWQFEKQGGGEFTCEVLEDLVRAFAFLQPEFAIGDIELADAIKIACERDEMEQRSLRNITFEA
ncbi:hypothetical protein K449DRAFT_447841 [Hypoxylon sp. EC38]|nr:hypothetical protein K449DRAFT_447841 [Hypoxylon sp. EC38]